ncbi:MAG: glycosyltransferase family 4 protein, partial [Haloferacaceae archaeon]
MEVAVVAMRTAQLCESGATVRTRRIAEGLAARGHDVTVLCARWWDGDLATFDQAGVTYRAVTGTPAAGTFATRLPPALARVRPDVVHAVNSPPAAVRAARATATALRAPLVVDWWTAHAADSAA